MFLENVLDKPDLQPIKKLYERMFMYMMQSIEFWLPDSELHTKAHSARVLLLALFLGHQKGLDDKELESLGLAAIFHDSRRLDDGVDKGHGARAADYYKEHCGINNLSFDERTYYITYYHDQDDSLGLRKIKESKIKDEQMVLLYQIFKDADALDRFRLGPDGLDERFLRTEEACGLVTFAKSLLQISSDRID